MPLPHANAAVAGSRGNKILLGGVVTLFVGIGYTFAGCRVPRFGNVFDQVPEAMNDEQLTADMAMVIYGWFIGCRVFVFCSSDGR